METFAERLKKLFAVLALLFAVRADCETLRPVDPAVDATNPALSVNKKHVPAGTSWQIGVPITYIVTVHNGGAPTSRATLTDTLPSGFVVTNVTCSSQFGATCPNPLTLPALGEFTMPTGGDVEFQISGYFTSSGIKVNTAAASAKDASGAALPVGSANTSIDQLNIPSKKLPVDLSIVKTVTPTTATFPAALHYTLKVTNSSAIGVYLGGIMQVRDLMSNSGVPVSFTATNLACTPTTNAVCPAMPTTGLSGSLSANLIFQYPSGNFGFLPANGSYTIAFDVRFTSSATCTNSAVAIYNNAYLDIANTVTIVDDTTPANNSSQVSTSITGITSPCPPLLVAKVEKKQLTASIWNAPGVKYSIQVSNANTVALTNIALTDQILKTIGTPPFKATVTAGPTCVSGCTNALTNVNVSSPNVSADSAWASLWTATLPTLGPAQTAVIEYTVVYAPVCETDPRADAIYNWFTASPANSGSASSYSQTVTKPPEANKCEFAVDKTIETSGAIVFEQPFDYQVTYQNLSATETRDVGTVRDVMLISSSQYGDLTVDYSTTCTAAGTITTVPLPKNVTGATIKYQPYAWIGVKLIDEHLSFGPGAKLTCKVKITPHRPKDDNPFCQGAGSPQLINSAFMDLSTNYNPNNSNPPGFFDTVSADLPLCRKVIVTKTADDHDVGPGAPITYTITVENKGNDPVSGLTLRDAVPLPLVANSVSPQCTPSAGCTGGTPALTTSTNTVNVTYATLAPNAPVSFTLKVTAPQAGGSYPNLAKATFLPGGNFYFQGNEAQLLQQEENITVLTPVLTKAFAPAKISANGTSTVTFTITNTNSDPKQTNMSFSDTLPAGLSLSGLTSDCGGTALVQSDGRTVTLTGGQLAAGKHSCTITARVAAMGVCGILRNNRSNFSNVVNLDVSGVDETLEVADCPPGLTITKNVTGAPEGYKGTFTFTVTCSGGYQKTVTVTWPTPGFTTLTDIPLGSQCTVKEGALPGGLPHEQAWTGTTYSPNGGVVTINDKGGQVEVVNTMGKDESECLRIFDSEVTCELDKSGKPTGNYVWRFRFQNLSGKPIYNLYVAGLPSPVVAAPNDYVSFSPPVTGTSPLVVFTFKNAQPGPLPIVLSLRDQALECCSGQVTIELPPCDCAQIVSDVKPSCFSSSLGVPPPYFYTFTLQNLSSMLAQNVIVTPVSTLDHVTPVSPSLVHVDKSVHPIAPVQPGGTIGPITVSLDGSQATGGKEVCLSLSVLTEDVDDCCSIVRCFKLPSCRFPFDDVTVIGNAVLTPRDPGFTISNIGATGNDGIAVDVRGAKRAGLAWRPLDSAGPLPSGAFIELRMLGEEMLDRIRVTKTATGSYAIDTTILDSPTYTVEVFEGGQLVGSAPQQSGINIIVIWPIAVSAELIDTTAFAKTLAFTLDTDRPVPWQLSDGSTLTGDRFRITPEQPRGTASFRTLELRAANIPTIEITGTAVFRDCNDNGVADAEDIASGTSRDADHNGVPDECQSASDLEVSLNTGYDDAAGALLPFGALPAGTNDDDWRVIAPGAERPAKIVINPPASWGEPLAGSRWISVDPDRGTSVPGASQLSFQRCFCIANDAQGIALDLQLRADNEASVSLNGHRIGGPGGAFNGSPLSVHVTGKAGDGLFAAGENCLRVDVADSGVSGGFTLAGTVTAPAGACPPR